MKTLFLGDVSPTGITDPLFKSGDLDTLFNDTLPLFAGNDIAFANMECALTESDKSIAKFGPPQKATPMVAGVLKKIGINYCGLSNNHFFDYGIQGAMDTMKYLDEAGIGYTGFGNNVDDSRRDLVIEKNGERIAIIAVCEHEYTYALEDRMGCRPFCEFDTPLDVRKAKAENDRVIVIYHGGKEHCLYPSPRLRKACQTLVKSGADMVLCQHSHCIGTYENFQGGHILYGQGNFHFVIKNSYKLSAFWDFGLAVGYDTKTNEITFTPTVNTDKGIRLANEQEYQQIMGAFEARNAELLDDRWKAGWHEFCVSKQEPYIAAIRKAYADLGDADTNETNNERFAHYLDCEAHTDVWRELCPTYNQTNEK